MSARYFGAAVTRLEDPRLLAGRGRYVDDMQFPGMLHAAFVRASVAHARIRNVDTSEASGMPGVATIYTMADFAGIAQGPMPPMASHPLLPTPITYHPLAVEEVRHVGEAIAIVLADDRARAEDAAAAVLLDIEELPAVADAVLASRAGAPRADSRRPSNIAATMKAGFSDCGAVFANADHVLTERFDIHRGGCHSMECRGVVASIDPHSGVLTLSTSSQSPYMVRRHLASYLNRDESQIHVMTPDVGGGFGPKANVYPEEFAVALAALKTGGRSNGSRTARSTSSPRRSSADRSGRSMWPSTMTGGCARSGAIAFTTTAPTRPTVSFCRQRPWPAFRAHTRSKRST